MIESSLLAKRLHKCHIVYVNCKLCERKKLVVFLSQTKHGMFTVNVLLLKRPKTEIQLNLELNDVLGNTNDIPCPKPRSI